MIDGLAAKKSPDRHNVSGESGESGAILHSPPLWIRILTAFLGLVGHSQLDSLEGPYCDHNGVLTLWNQFASPHEHFIEHQAA